MNIRIDIFLPIDLIPDLCLVVSIFYIKVIMLFYFFRWFFPWDRYVEHAPIARGRGRLAVLLILMLTLEYLNIGIINIYSEYIQNELYDAKIAILADPTSLNAIKYDFLQLRGSFWRMILRYYPLFFGALAAYARATFSARHSKIKNA